MNFGSAVASPKNHKWNGCSPGWMSHPRWKIFPNWPDHLRGQGYQIGALQFLQNHSQGPQNHGTGPFFGVWVQIAMSAVCLPKLSNGVISWWRLSLKMGIIQFPETGGLDVHPVDIKSQLTELGGSLIYNPVPQSHLLGIGMACGDGGRSMFIWSSRMAPWRSQPAACSSL